MALMLVAGAAQAYEAGDMVVRTGGVGASGCLQYIPRHYQSLRWVWSMAWMSKTILNWAYPLRISITPSWGIEVLGATPFKHDIVTSKNLIWRVPNWQKPNICPRPLAWVVFIRWLDLQIQPVWARA